MEDPAKEIEHVVRLLTTAENADIQQAAIERYFVREAAFNHPIVKVNPSYRSRDSILGIYQWYRIMSPRIELQVDDVVYSKQKMKMFLNIRQKFHIFLSPLKPAEARLVVQLTLTQSDDGLYYIKRQEDFYQPEETVKFVVPPLGHIVLLVKYVGALLSNINAWAFQSVGFWRPSRRASH